jgi:uncharacterized membrane protein YheB (UPF0754 family)
MYAMAIQQGMSALAAAADPEGTPEFANAYNMAAARFRSASAKNTAERNISAVRQDKILTNTKIQLQATQAEAAQKVQNAVLGRVGDSADTVKDNIQKTASQMTQANEKESRQREERLLAEVNNSQSSMLSQRDQSQSFASGLLQTFSAFEFSDLKLTNDLVDKMTSTPKKGTK